MPNFHANFMFWKFWKLERLRTIPFTVLFYPNEILLGPSEIIIIYQSEFEFYLNEISLDQSEITFDLSEILFYQSEKTFDISEILFY